MTAKKTITVVVASLALGGAAFGTVAAASNGTGRGGRLRPPTSSVTLGVSRR
jgi:hypothetical protein